jgi:hypothetical protein
MVWWNLLGCFVFPKRFSTHSWNDDNKVGMFKSQYPINSREFIVYLVCKALKEIALCLWYEEHLYEIFFYISSRISRYFVA